MKISLVQKILDILRLKTFKDYLNCNPVALRGLLNFLSLFEYRNRNSIMQTRLLRFIGCNVGKNVHLGCNLHIYLPRNLTIEDNVWISDNNKFLCWNKIHLKQMSFTSVNVSFLAGSHNVNDYSDVIDNQDIYIKNGVWIGANATILGGAGIGKGCIIGAGSICLGKEYSEFCIYAGNPAKKIKERQPSDVIYQPVTYKLEEIINE